MSSLNVASATSTANALDVIIVGYATSDVTINLTLSKSLQSFRNVVNQRDWTQEAKIALDRLGLNQRLTRDTQSPLELFQHALKEYERPSGHGENPTPILIGLRECINSTIGILLKHRPNQESTSNRGSKVKSILKQVAKSSITGEAIDDLADTAPRICDRLTVVGKQAVASRESIQDLFKEGCSFLSGFLNAIDDSKLRR